MVDYKVTEVGPLDAWSKLAGVAPGKSFVEQDLGSSNIGISVNSTPPGGTSPFWHTHSKIEEIYVFIEGTGEVALDDDTVEVGPGTIVRVGPNVWRALRCAPDSAAPLKWLCVRGGEGTLAEIGNDADIDSDRPYPWT